MKKYVKPDLFYENFELSQSVANCSLSLNHGKSEKDCTYDMNDHEWLPAILGPNMTIFTVEVNCTNGEDSLGDYCYQTGSATFNIFTS